MQTYLHAGTPHTYTWKITMLSTGNNSVFSRPMKLPCPMTGYWRIKLRSSDILPNLTGNKKFHEKALFLAVVVTGCRITGTYYHDCIPESKSNTEHTDKSFLIQTENITSRCQHGRSGGSECGDVFFLFLFLIFLYLSKFTFKNFQTCHLK